jgi:hypothetical protein
MGEYATRTTDGERVKIGTCEDMYYLRADQATLVRATEDDQTDPIRYAAELRFRFPFPDEDAVGPGGFLDPFRSLPVYVDELPAFDHSTVQFTARVGYIMSIPCPESAEGQALAKTLPHGIGKNGWRGGTARIVQQRVWDGALALVAACAGCDAKYRLETFEMAQPYIVACRSHADELEHLATVDPRRNGITPRAWDAQITYWHTVADRIAAGYTNPPAWVTTL